MAPPMPSAVGVAATSCALVPSSAAPCRSLMQRREAASSHVARRVLVPCKAPCASLPLRAAAPCASSSSSGSPTADPEQAEPSPPSPVAPSAQAQSPRNSILCTTCDGNGAVVCGQCDGGGVNLKDHFEGRFKTGQLCWLCRGKKQVLCGSCNGAGFMGGFLSTQDD